MDYCCRSTPPNQARPIPAILMYYIRVSKLSAMLLGNRCYCFAFVGARVGVFCTYTCTHNNCTTTCRMS